MSKKFKGFTRVGLMAGAEFGGDTFRPWRVRKAREDFLKRDVDFILHLGCLLNVSALSKSFAQAIEKKSHKKTDAKFKSDDRVRFCEHAIERVLEDVLPSITGQDGEFLKYWVFPCPLFEIKKEEDEFGLAEYIYDHLAEASFEKTGKVYVVVNNIDELVEVEDNVAIKTLGVIMPTTSFFRSKILSTPIEREISYQQLSSGGRDIPDLYIAGSFAASISEVNPRSVSESRPYVSIPSLSIRSFAKRKVILQNTLGYAIVNLYPEKKNRAQFTTDFMPLNDAIELECEFAKREVQLFKNPDQVKVAEALIEKIRIGTKPTIGKIEQATGLSRERVLKAFNRLKNKVFGVDIELGGIDDPHKIIPNTKKDLTLYRKGERQEKISAAGACLHIPDKSVDYDFLENDLPAILLEENTTKLYWVGDLSEGNKYDQDRNGLLLDRFNFPQDQKKLAGFLVAKLVFKVFRPRFEKAEADFKREAEKNVPSQDQPQVVMDINDLVEKSLLEVTTTPGNHDKVRNEPALEHYQQVLVAALIQLIYRYLMNRGFMAEHDRIETIVRTKIKLLDNPAMDGNVGLLHEFSQSNEQSTGKVQKAIKQFKVLCSNIKTLLLANHHEENFSLFRIGKKTFKAFHLGTLKRFYEFESQRSKISEFGLAFFRDVFVGDELVEVNVKFVPSRIDFEMKNAAEFMEKNRSRGPKYFEELKRFLEKGEIEVSDQ